MTTRLASFPLRPADGAIACDAFCSLDDGLCHAVFLGRDGAITDLTYDRTGKRRDARIIGTVPGALDVTAFWSEENNVRNVITVGSDGDAWHFIQDGDGGSWKRSLQRNVPGAQRVAGYDEHHHGIALTGSGEITDQPFHTVSAVSEARFREATAAALAARGGAPSAAVATLKHEQGEPEKPIVVGNLHAAVDIAALWADGQDRFVIAAEHSGAITELGYGIHQPETRRELARIPGVTSVSACYVEEPATGRRVVALTKDGGVHMLRYGADLPTLGSPLATLRAVDVALFKTPDGEVHTVLLAGGEIVDIAGR